MSTTGFGISQTVGSIDGTHQEIQCPKNAGSLYFNYKDYHSLVVQAVADANYNFVVFDIGDYGRNSDGSVFRESAFGQDFENNRLDLPPPKALPNTDQELPFVFLADEAYPLRENLLTPYARRSLSNPSRIFNARLSRARKSVECTFGLVKKKIEVLQRPIRCSVERATIIIQASYTLHNFVRQREGSPLQANTENIVNNNITSLGPVVYSGRHSLRAKEVRDGFRNYFVSNEGSVPWVTAKYTV
ncbi:nuclease harbi1-like protein [Plakobranchus ocellatus]|uniref:Nuclease harbi1-like protein n=1 Tax=Plakobranchus ocellatus TaxID=259542 RepID=A0AAV3Z185_9GAST|nr:nuclease harbi1-like protein [Plakobranchus ocellatus]